MHTVLDNIDSRDVGALGDIELLASLRQLLADERTLSARMLVHLGEVDARGLYREHAFGSIYLSPDGKRCDQCGFLELHHEQPFGRGGLATPSNIRVLCRAHNQFLAERDYGGAFMRQRIERAQGERGEG